MKRRLRMKVWWPGCDKDAEMFCKTCHPCQMVSMPKPPEPLKRTELPSGLWQHISAVVEYYSRYMEVEVLRSTTADKIIASLKKIFLTRGLPVSITTDNGPQFISEDFRKFVEEAGMHWTQKSDSTLASGEWRGRETEPFPTKEDQDCTNREEKLERRNCILSVDVQNNSTQYHWSKPCRTPVP